jgi:hypothetical protein
MLPEMETSLSMHEHTAMFLDLKRLRNAHSTYIGEWKFLMRAT